MDNTYFMQYGIPQKWCASIMFLEELMDEATKSLDEMA